MKGYSHLHTCTFSYSVREYGDLQWKQITEGLPRKNAILKYDWPAQRKWTTTERSVLKLANLDHSLFFLILLLNIRPCLQWHLVAIMFMELCYSTQLCTGLEEICNTSHSHSCARLIFQ